MNVKNRRIPDDEPRRTVYDRCRKKAFDAEHKRKLLFNIGQYDKKVVVGKQQYSNLPLARKKASAIKSKVIENLENYLLEFEANAKKNGIKVIWAETGEVAMKEIIDYTKTSKCQNNS